MSARLNHTIVWCRDKKKKSAHFLADVLGLPPPRRFMHFLMSKLRQSPWGEGFTDQS